MTGRPRSCTVIVATYRQPEWLEKVLWGFAAQGCDDFEVIVTDDGSGPETARVVERIARESALRLRHLWQEDRGFRKCRALNRAILAARGEYLIFTDGDCVPRDDLVDRHLDLAEPGAFLGGAAVRLPSEAGRAMGRKEILSGRATSPAWLLRHGWRPGHRLFRAFRSRRLGAILDTITPTKAVFNGGNSSVWREAAVAVNGFDEQMAYRGEDGAFGDRLVNLGLEARQVRWRAVTYHLDHDRPYVSDEMLERNLAIRRRIWREGEVRARRGLAELSGRENAPRGRSP